MNAPAYLPPKLRLVSNTPDRLVQALRDLHSALGAALQELEQPEPLRNTKYRFASMAVGDWFKAPLSERGRLSAAASQWGKRHGRTFSVRKYGDLLKVRRVS